MSKAKGAAPRCLDPMLAATARRGYPTAVPEPPPMIELAVTILVALLVLGATQVPALGDALGRFVRGPPDRHPSPPGRPPPQAEPKDASPPLRPGRSAD